MTNTERYYHTHKTYRDAVRQLQADRQSAMERVERYKGSLGYDNEKQIIEKEYREKVREVADTARADFDAVLSEMQRNAEREKKIEPPTAEQESLLRVLQMRKTVKPDELNQASEFLKGNRLALSVLDEIAQKHNYYTHFADPQTGDVIKSLASFASTTVSMPHVDNREGWINGQERRVDFYSADRDFSDTTDCISFAGNVNDVSVFAEIVD